MPSSKTKHYVVEKIVSKRTDSRGQALYLIKWKGYSSSKNTWEPEEHLVNCQDMVQAFNDKRTKRNRSTYLDSDSDSTQGHARQRTRSSIQHQQLSTDSSSSMDDEDGCVIEKSSSKRLRQSTTDTEMTSSTDSYDSDIMNTAKLNEIIDVRRNKDSYQVEYNVRLKRIRKSVWVNSSQLTQHYAQEVINFLEEEYV